MKARVEVGMNEADTRRHYYYKQKLLKAGDSYYIRFCNWLASDTPVVLMPDVPADRKNCLRKNHEAKTR